MKFTLKEDVEDIVSPEVQKVDSEAQKAALIGILNNYINKEWENLNELNSVITTIQYEDADQKEVLEILGNIVTEKNIHIGMLTKALSYLDPKTQELMDTGVEKAEAIVAEPASQDLK